MDEKTVKFHEILSVNGLDWDAFRRALMTHDSTDAGVFTVKSLFNGQVILCTEMDCFLWGSWRTDGYCLIQQDAWEELPQEFKDILEGPPSYSWDMKSYRR